MRVYRQDSDSDASSSTTEMSEDLSGSSSNSEVRAKDDKRRKLRMKKTNEVLSNELVYQPKFSKIVRESTKNLSKYSEEGHSIAISDDSKPK